MDILIKSFNRPYYLDKCLQSIMNFVTDSNLKIVVLDDGTPEKYLEKLKLKYPIIEIRESEYYNEKVTLINADSKDFIQNIPINLWLEAARKASDFFVLIEDDIWFSKPINFQKIEKDLKLNKIQMLKLYWLGNSKLIPKKIFKKTDNINIYKEKLLTKNVFFYNLVFNTKKFFIGHLMHYLKINTEQRLLNYYHVYATAGAIFDKNYFLNLWHNHQNKVDENLQLKNSLKFLKLNKNSFFGHLNQEVAKTGFASAATNTNKNYDNINIDIFKLNKILNQAWFKDEFLTANNFDNDLDFSEIEMILQKNQNPDLSKSEWQKWTTAFKNQYLSFGCQID